MIDNFILKYLCINKNKETYECMAKYIIKFYN